MVGHNLNETLIQLIARKATGKGTLVNLSATENGNYDPADEDPPVDGYNYVSVSVETYEDELAQALADLAAAQAEIADYQACQAAVISKIQEYDPNFDPQTCEDIVDKIEEEEEEKKEAEEVLEGVAKEVGVDPEDPTYPDNVLPAVKEGEGYTFPTGTDLNTQIYPLIGSTDTVTDLTMGKCITGWGKPYNYTEPSGYPPGYRGYEFSVGYITTADGVYHHIYGTRAAWVYYAEPCTAAWVENAKIADSTNGAVEVDFVYVQGGTEHRLHFTGIDNPNYRSNELIGYGDSGHTFKAKNS